MSTYEQLEADCLQDLRRLGLGLAGRPESPLGVIVSNHGEVLSWPETLDTETWDNLGRWLGSLAGWLAYAKSQAALADAVRLKAELQTRQVQAQAFARAEGKVTERRALAEADEDLTAARALEVQAEARHKLIEGITSGLEAQYAAVSRELARRTGEQRAERKAQP